ncbi:MAG: folylpolyglutamate synthase/dihydrofolate synthase family protein [Ndongobacter sp.]|nr:folylpolyglutamate synthase/dihydrofolate synthase family protein [Ndongobacter sp.]
MSDTNSLTYSLPPLPFSNADEAIDAIHAKEWAQSRPGLERIAELMALLGHPEKTLRIIHVAGTNGKGSFCAMLSSVLHAAGYRVGVNLSPPLYDFSERIQIDRQPIPAPRLCAIASRIFSLIPEMSEPPTQFEIITAMSLVHFAEEACDFVVLEVGMGGRLDSTNVIPAPVLCAITSIGLDHTAFLGSTLTQIAKEKAGILKSGTKAVFAAQAPEVTAELQKAAEALGIPYVFVDEAQITQQGWDVRRQHFTYRSDGPYHLALLGTYQTKNAALVLEAVRMLRTCGIDISEDALKKGFPRAVHPGRFEIIKTRPFWIADGAHNPAGAHALAETLRECFPDQKCHILFGVFADKDVDEMIRTLAPLAEKAYCITPPTERALAGSALAAKWAENAPDVPASAYSNLTEAVCAIECALAATDVVVACGSLSYLGAFRSLLQNRMGDLKSCTAGICARP